MKVTFEWKGGVFLKTRNSAQPHRYVGNIDLLELEKGNGFDNIGSVKKHNENK